MKLISNALIPTAVLIGFTGLVVGLTVLQLERWYRFIGSNLSFSLVLVLTGYLAVKRFKDSDIQIVIATACNVLLIISARTYFFAILKNYRWANFELWQLTLFVVFFMALGGSIKKAVLLKSNRPKISWKQHYEAAQNYRMYWLFRLAGIIAGVLFVSMPIIMIWSNSSFFEEILHARNIVVVAFLLMISLTALLGVFFLSYCVGGKTPEYVLRMIEYLMRNEGQ